MRIVIALGGNALLRRGEEMTAENQRKNIQLAVKSLAPIAGQNELVISHGNGPQVGLLSLQSAAYKEVEEYPLDIFCLLYTSPSPRDYPGSRMPSSA